MDFPGMYERYTEFHFFYGGYFSQWFYCDFEVDGIKYNCAEQYMMGEKARLFGDKEVEAKIMASRKNWEQKALGKKVRGFEKAKWEAVATDIVYKGNYAKFTQNKGLLYELMSYKDQLFVEASPTDEIWGIRMGMEDPGIEDPGNWKGTNWLGKVLTKLREDLLAQVATEVENALEGCT